MDLSNKRQLATQIEIKRTLQRLAFQVLEQRGQANDLALVGIQRRGVELAARIRRSLTERLGYEVPFGKLDINLYRDDWTTMQAQPRINQTDIPFSVYGSQIVLVDDVLYTGRTIRAALEAILDFGRPKRVELLVLVDRGHRELPIQADYCGKRLETAETERVDVLVQERDGQDAIVLSRQD